MNINFIQRKNNKNYNKDYSEKRFINFVFLICITTFIIGCLVSCGFPSIDCEDKIIEREVLKLAREEIERDRKDFGKDFTLKLGYMETLEIDKEKCHCLGLLTIGLKDGEYPVYLNYSASRKGFSKDVYIGISFDTL